MKTGKEDRDGKQSGAYFKCVSAGAFTDCDSGSERTRD
jgi:hypothetical protein